MTVGVTCCFNFDLCLSLFKWILINKKKKKFFTHIKPLLPMTVIKWSLPLHSPMSYIILNLHLLNPWQVSGFVLWQELYFWNVKVLPIKTFIISFSFTHSLQINQVYLFVTTSLHLSDFLIWRAKCLALILYLLISVIVKFWQFDLSVPFLYLPRRSHL